MTLEHSDSVSSVTICNINQQQQPKYGYWIVSGSWDKSVKIWESENGECIAELLGSSHWINHVSISPGR